MTKTMKEIHSEISENIMRLRREKGMTQEKLANEIDCSQAFINQIETKAKDCNVEHIYKISSVLECSIYDILPNTKLDMENTNDNK